MEAVNEKQIEKDLVEGLRNAEAQENNSVAPLAVDTGKPRLNLGNISVKLFCQAENAVVFRLATRDVSPVVRKNLAHLNVTSDEEVKLTKEAIDHYGSDHLSPELIELLNKYTNTPLGPLISFKIDQYNLLRAKVKLEAIRLEKEAQGAS